MQVLGRVDEISEHRARRGTPAGAAPQQHELPDRLAFDEHRVERPAHRRQRVAVRDHRRVHAHADRAVVFLADRQQLHRVPELGRGRDVFGRDVRDPAHAA